MQLSPTRAAQAAAPRRSAPVPAAPIAVAYGDGIGPEIMDATLRVLDAAGARLALRPVQIGERVYARGHSAGIEPGAWDVLRETRVFLKAPITTPQGGGVKSLNVTVRKTLGLYANVRPCVAYHPFVRTRHPTMDVVIVRENEEDLYAGIEHRQTDQVVQCLKLISVPGTEKIVRYAFEYARRHGRRKVSCFTKDNIMKLTDGLFHRVFEQVAAEYPELEHEHLIVDIGAAKLADTPERFDVVVLPNLYGDILSDVTAQISGSVGLAPSANVGDGIAMFEAIHGSAPRLAGQDVANPSGLLLSGVMMLAHLGQHAAAERVHNAWLATLEDGVLTKDLHTGAPGQRRVGTRAFADAVIERLGEEPRQLRPVRYDAGAGAMPTIRPAPGAPAKKELVGVDVFLHWTAGDANALAKRVAACGSEELRLAMITNRGVKVWPQGLPETFCTDHWRCRFQAPRAVSHAAVVALLARLNEAGLDFVKTEGLFTFDGQPGYSLGQGQ